MGEVAFAVPILPGKKMALEELCRTLQGPKSKDAAEAMRRHGNDKETWFIQSSPQGDLCIVYWEADPPHKPMEVFVGSKHPFDLWLKGELRQITGIDFNNPPKMEFPKQAFRGGY